MIYQDFNHPKWCGVLLQLYKNPSGPGATSFNKHIPSLSPTCTEEPNRSSNSWGKAPMAFLHVRILTMPKLGCGSVCVLSFLFQIPDRVNRLGIRVLHIANSLKFDWVEIPLHWYHRFERKDKILSRKYQMFGNTPIHNTHNAGWLHMFKLDTNLSLFGVLDFKPEIDWQTQKTPPIVSWCILQSTRIPSHTNRKPTISNIWKYTKYMYFRHFGAMNPKCLWQTVESWWVEINGRLTQPKTPWVTSCISRVHW